MAAALVPALLLVGLARMGARMGISQGALIFGQPLVGHEPATRVGPTRGYDDHRKAQVAASIPVGAAVLLAAALFYFAAAMILVENRSPPFLLLYASMLLIPWTAVLLVRGPLRNHPDIAVLGADLVLTASMVGQLLLPFEPPAGVALILALKMVATAWFFPWDPRMQCASAAGTVVLYWLVLLVHGVPHSQSMVLHEVFGPLAAAILSIGGAAMADRTRRAIFERDLTLTRSQTELRFLLDQAKKNEDRLREANAVKSDFVAIMSHELRTPLNTIIGYTDLLGEGEFGPLNSEQQARLEVVRKSSRELLELIETVLDLNRLESARLPVHLEEIDVGAFARQVCEGMGSLERKPQVRFECRADGHCGKMRTDPMKLRTILKNLVGNALKFTDRGIVALELRPLGPGIEITVRDSGIGIAPEHHEVIFESFRQIQPANTRRHGGVGLGLYIVRRLVRALGGRIRVESRLGQGAKFVVWLPGRIPCQSESAAAPSGGEGPCRQDPAPAGASSSTPRG